MSTVFNKKLVFIPALLLLIPSILIGRWVLGDINAYTVRYSVQQWQTENRLPSTSELTSAQTAIHAALSWNDTPEYRDYEGRLFHYQSLISENQLLKNTALNSALNSYRASTKQRPQWPYSWANLALIKALIGELDSEYQHAIRQAALNGPWENGVNIALTEAGLIGWLRLDRTEQKIITENIQRGIRRNLKHIKVIINRYNKRSLICANLKRDKYQRKLCGF